MKIKHGLGVQFCTSILLNYRDCMRAIKKKSVACGELATPWFQSESTRGKFTYNCNTQGRSQDLGIGGGGGGGNREPKKFNPAKLIAFALTSKVEAIRGSRAVVEAIVPWTIYFATVDDAKLSIMNQKGPKITSWTNKNLDFKWSYL
jgi:hypothetical protein